MRRWATRTQCGLVVTERLGYPASCTTVLVVDGFAVRIYLPAREDQPPHVHVIVDEHRDDLLAAWNRYHD